MTFEKKWKNAYWKTFYEKKKSSTCSPVYSRDPESLSTASIRYNPSKHKYLDNNKSRQTRTEEKEVEKIHSSENWIRFMVSCLPFTASKAGTKIFRVWLDSNLNFWVRHPQALKQRLNPVVITQCLRYQQTIIGGKLCLGRKRQKLLRIIRFGAVHWFPKGKRLNCLNKSLLTSPHDPKTYTSRRQKKVC